MTTATSKTPTRPRGRLAAVWFADIVGYTSLAATDHRRALAVVEAFQELAEREVEEHGGRLVKFIGDAALAEFTSTSAAVQAASDLQRAFSGRSEELGCRTDLRVGVHLGEIEAAPDGDIYGDGVNTASRLQGAAEPGHVLVSEDVRRSLRSHPQFGFVPAGRRRLRGTAAPMAVFEALTADDANTPWFGATGLAWLRGWRLLVLLVAYMAAGTSLLIGVNGMVLRGQMPRLALDVAAIWVAGVVPLLLVAAWYHGYRRHRSARRGERLLAGALVLGMLGLTGVAVARHVDREQARALATAGDLDPRQIAVLYFDDLGGDEANSYLAAGFTEGLIDELSGIRALDVVSPNGVAPFRDGTLPPDSIARRLRAGTIVDGSIEQRDGMLRLNVRLIDGVSGADIRRDAFQLPSSDLLEARQELVSRVAGFLREWLGDEIRLRQRRRSTESVAAWVLVQRAAEERRDGDEALEHGDGAAAMAAYQAADSMLARAATLDEAWTEPLVMRGRIAYDISRASHDPHEAIAWNEQAREHAVAALSRDPNDPAALELRGTSDYWRYLLDAEPDEEAHRRLLVDARTDLEEATRIDPSRASAYSTLSHLYYNYDLSEAVIAARRAYEEDAYLDVADAVLWRLFNGHLDLGQFTQAVRSCNDGRQQFPERHQFTTCRLMLMATPALPPDVDAAWRLAQHVDSIAGEDERAYASILSELSVGGVIARAGMQDSARAVLLRARERVTPEVDPKQELFAYEAYMRTLTGDEEEARKLLLRYAAANPGHLAAAHGSDTAWWWSELRTRPWFQELAGR